MPKPMSMPMSMPVPACPCSCPCPWLPTPAPAPAPWPVPVAAPVAVPMPVPAPIPIAARWIRHLPAERQWSAQKTLIVQNSAHRKGSAGAALPPPPPASAQGRSAGYVGRVRGTSGARWVCAGERGRAICRMSAGILHRFCTIFQPEQAASARGGGAMGKVSTGGSRGVTYRGREHLARHEEVR